LIRRLRDLAQHCLRLKGKPIDTRQIGRELGARYVLEGGVQNAGERTRFNAQLVDTESGAHLCAERLDKQCTNLLDMQDEVTTRLAHEIHIELIAAESRRAAREHPDQLASVDHTLHGWAAWYRHRSLEAAQQARHFFEAALRLDGYNVDALLGFADTHVGGQHVRIRRSCGPDPRGRGSSDKGVGIGPGTTPMRM
jgi:hypothetical protein